MQRLLTGYSISFNRKYDRQGHLFQGRYNARLVNSEAYLFKLITYIHLNPLRAGLITTIEELDEYPWSGHRSVITGNGHEWHDLQSLLKYYGESGKDCVSNYHAHICAALDTGGQSADAAGFLGEFAYSDRGVEDDRMSNQIISTSSEELFMAVRRSIESHYGVSLKPVQRGVRPPQKLAEARAVLIFLMLGQGMTTAELSRRLGISKPAASKALLKGKALAENEPTLLEMLPWKKREAVVKRPPENS